MLFRRLIYYRVASIILNLRTNLEKFHACFYQTLLEIKNVWLFFLLALNELEKLSIGIRRVTYCLSALTNHQASPQSEYCNIPQSVSV